MQHQLLEQVAVVVEVIMEVLVFRLVLEEQVELVVVDLVDQYQLLDNQQKLLQEQLTLAVAVVEAVLIKRMEKQADLV